MKLLPILLLMACSPTRTIPPPCEELCGIVIWGEIDMVSPDGGTCRLVSKECRGER